jgi:hypothetical protein
MLPDSFAQTGHGLALSKESGEPLTEWCTEEGGILCQFRLPLNANFQHGSEHVFRQTMVDDLSTTMPASSRTESFFSADFVGMRGRKVSIIIPTYKDWEALSHACMRWKSRHIQMN